MTNKILILLLTTFVIYSATEIQDENISFLRGDVETVPIHNEKSSAYTLEDIFGTKSLPLRTSVESPPSSLINLRVPLRDAVEYSPSEEDGDAELVEFEPDNAQDLTVSKIKSIVSEKLNYEPVVKDFDDENKYDHYKAYYIPTQYEDEKPQPFRYGSPYQELVEETPDQELVDLNSYNELHRSAIKQTKEYKVVCFITNWAFYRRNEGNFVPEYLSNNNLCTHVVYSFATLDPATLTMKEFDAWADLDNDLYRRATKLNVPVLLALGGWTDSVGDKYSRLVSNPGARSKFISNAIQFLKMYGFSGLHFDWNYPVCWQSDCSKGPETDKPNLTKFVEELQSELAKQGLMLGVGISGYKEVIKVAYDIKRLSEVADYLTVMTYDYHGSWEGQTGHISPLYGSSSDKYPQYNTDYTMQMLVKMGAVKSKLIVGVPFYGQTFTLTRVRSSGDIAREGTPSSGPGDAGEYTRQPGMMAYYEICYRVRKLKWHVGRDASLNSGPYATMGDQWVGYDDPVSVTVKSKYVIKSGFGGIAAWTVDLDDFQNKCCEEPFPVLSAINRALGRLDTPSPTHTNCAKPGQPATPAPAVMTLAPDNGLAGIQTTQRTTTTQEPTEHEHTTASLTWTTPSTTRTTTRRRTTTTTTPEPTTTTTTTPKPTTTTTTTPEPTSTVAQTTTTRRRTTSTRRRTTTTTTTTEAPEEEEEEEVPVTQAPYVEGTTIPVPGIIMPEIGEGEPCDHNEYLAHPNNCNAFYRCVLGEFKTQYCAGGLHWNAQFSLCDWPSNAKCTLDKPQDEPQPVEVSTQRETTTTTRRRRTTTTARRPSRTTTTTTTEAPTTVRQTTTRRPSRKPTTTTQRTTTTKYPQLQSPQEGCINGDYYPHRECDSFYICVNAKKVVQQCGPGLQWNHEDLSCDWEDRVRCISMNDYYRLSNLKALGEDDPCSDETHLPYPGDCTQYLQCAHNRLVAKECAPGLHWNQYQKICDWPIHAKCKDAAVAGSGISLPEIDQDIDKPGTTTSTAAPTTTTTTPRPILAPFSGDFKLVCYFTNWAWYRKGFGKYTPDSINTDLCTHIVYGFAVLNRDSLTIKTHDSWADIDNKFYTRVVALKEKGIKVTLALGGWNDSLGDKYSRLVRNAEARARFIEHAIEFLDKFGFEGLDLDWEYPVCWQVDCTKGFADEKEGFSALVRELSAAFKPRGLLLSAAVSPSKTVIDAGYDVPELSKYFDWIAVMTYDFHGQWDKKTGHVAPLYYHPEDDIAFFNTNYTINYWIEKGAPRQKIVMGMPLYGQAFTLADKNHNGLNAKAPKGGTAGEFTKASGFLAYYEICDRILRKNWTVVKDEQGRMGPYAYSGNQWVSFDDKETLMRKVQFIRAMKLGGGMIWALDLDDFKNRCGTGHHPLLHAIRDGLKDPPSPDDALPPLLSPPNNIDQKLEEVEEFENLEEATDYAAQADEYKVVCYFTNWAWYRQNHGKYLPEDIDADLCTHIVYGFAVLDRDKLTIKPHDSWADLDNRFYERVVAFKQKGKKVTVAIGGWNDSAGDKYSRLVRSAAARAKFIKHVMEFIAKYQFDGLDLDWEYPVCWQVECNKGYADEKESFASLVQELSTAFKPKGYLLSSAVSPAKKVIDAGYDVPILSNYFDWIAVMAYDYHGQWDKKTGHVAPMYAHPDDFDQTFNSNFTINYWIQQGADPKKLIMGMPMYGQSFSLADNSNNGLNAPTYGGGEAGEGTRARGFLSYYEICENIRKKGWEVVRDRKGRMGPYAFLKDQWVSFDDVYMIRHKSEYVKAMGLGGAMIWALDLDDFRNNCDCEEYPLLRTINRVLRNYPGPAPVCKLESTSGGSPMKPSKPMKPAKPVTTTTKRPQVVQVTTTAQPPKTTSRRKSTRRTTTRAQYTTNKPTTTTTSSFELENEIPEEAICTGRLFMPHKDCNKYYICQYGKPYEQSCPQGLHWNVDHCDWPQEAKCDSIQEPNIPEVTTSRPTRTTTKRRATTQATKPATRPTAAPTRPPPPPVTDNVIVSNDNTYKVVCYFTNWAWYRPGDGKYTPDDIDATLCTHIVYGFAVLNRESLTIKTHDSWADIDNRFYERVCEYKRKGIKVTLALGGWNDSLGDKYSKLVRDPAARARFVKQAVEFIEKYGFEGLDLDWEYPVCWQVDCTKGYPDEKEGFAELVKELAVEFRPRGYLLSAAVSPSKMVIDAGYDVPGLAEYFDWIAVMTYDFHGHWDKQTGHVAPLYYYPGDTYDYFNANFSINYWIQKGAPSKKLVMGMPLYGQSFSLTDSNQHGMNAKSVGAGEAGEFTRAGGFLAFYEICEKVNRNGWSVERDPQGRIGPYAYNGNQWVSYDDVDEIRRKSQYVKQMNLGGGMVWALDLDDFRGRCGCGKHPLLKTMNQELGRISTGQLNNCT